MQILRLQIQGLRVLDAVDLTLAPDANLFRGPNGAGKTALLEAVHLLATGRSFRSGGPSSLVAHGQSALMVRVHLDKGMTLALQRERNGDVQLKRGVDSVRRIAEIAAEIPVQLLLPDASELIFGGPSERRRALDWGLFHVEQSYPALARNYAQALRQRNSLLRRAQIEGSRISKELTVWSERTSELGEQVSRARLDYVRRLESCFEQVLEKLSPKLCLSIDYQPGHKIGQMAAQLQQERLREIKLGVTGFGPHRADLKIRISKRLAGSVLSRGQGKIAAIALRLAQARDLKEQRGIAPLFLIDDVGAELDTGHNERLFQYLQGLDCQVLATTALDELPRMKNWTMNWRLFHVEQGRVTAANGAD